HQGRLLTLPRLPDRPEEKRALGRQYDALAVDPVSAAVARACKPQNVPFACVRVVTDEVETAQPPGGLSLLARWRAAGQAQKAAEQLGKALGELLTLTLPFPVD